MGGTAHPIAGMPSDQIVLLSFATLQNECTRSSFSSICLALCWLSGHGGQTCESGCLIPLFIPVTLSFCVPSPWECYASLLDFEMVAESAFVFFPLFFFDAHKIVMAYPQHLHTHPRCKRYLRPKSRFTSATQFGLAQLLFSAYKWPNSRTHCTVDVLLLPRFPSSGMTKWGEAGWHFFLGWG